ncbi:hypothetical protein BDV96DRAFT_589557 [Lophiotrema nucula]|uniref:Uncharacterized protein n=1 Tax=Lophiotrema nucula TaxID=690887 RepID=A0A6A5YK14_9PLEO|nr:hypothetical protein BDV96DRAFT_589557 [Lophiotrema nucula]
MTSLREVCKALKTSTSGHAQLFADLLANDGKNGPLKVNQRSKARERFGTDPLNLPQVGGKISPFPSPLSIAKLQETLLKDLSTQKEGNVVFFPPQEFPVEDIAKATDLINNIDDANYRWSGLIPSLASPTLDSMRKDCKEIFTNILGETQTTVSVLPQNTFLKLQHFNESFTYSTVLTGTMTSIIWPPTKHNLDILQYAYAHLAETNSLNSLDVTEDLEGGVAFVQYPGDTVRCPPFGLMTAFAQQATVIAKYSVITADSFLMALRHLPFLETWWKTEIDESQKRSTFALAVCDIITQILDGDFDTLDLEKLQYPLEKDSALLCLLNAWDEINNDVRRLLNDQAAGRLKQKWRAFLRGCQGNTCMLCGQKFKRSKGDGEKEHFETHHWAGEGGDEDAMDVDV